MKMGVREDNKNKKRNIINELYINLAVDSQLKTHFSNIIFKVYPTAEIQNLSSLYKTKIKSKFVKEKANP